MLSKDSILPDDHLVWSDVEFVHAVKLMSSPLSRRSCHSQSIAVLPCHKRNNLKNGDL